jgi:uncharacterized protein YlxW (UPF0749 family)
MSIGKSSSIVVVCIILGVLISWQYRSISANSKIDTVQSTRLEDLKDRLISEKNNNDNLRKRNEELAKQNSEYENARGNIDLYEKNLKLELERARMVAGLTDVKGRGVVIVLSNGETGGGVVEDTDLLGLINELRTSDAQAISVNEQRVVSNTEVRKAGENIVINGVPMRIPFSIKAISDPNKMENSLRMIGGIVERLETYNIKITIDKKDSLVIPKVRDDGMVIKTDLLTPVNK